MTTDRHLDLMALMREIENPSKAYYGSVRLASSTHTDSLEWQRAVGRGGQALDAIETAVRAWVAAHPAEEQPADRAALRDRIAVRLAEEDGWEYAEGLGLRDMSEDMQQHYDKLADAVLAVLPETDQPGLLAKVDEATATLRRIRSTIRTLRDRGATGRVYYQSITDDLAGPRPDRDEASSPSRMADEAQQPETQAFVCKCPAELCHCGHHAAVSQPAVGAQQPETQADCNSGVGWYEVIHPRNATTCIAYAHEDGSLYLPEGDDLTPDEFAFAAARGNAHRLVRADEPAAVSQPGKEPTS